MLNRHTVNWLSIWLSLSKLSLSLWMLDIWLWLSKLPLKLGWLLVLLLHRVDLLHRVLLPWHRMELLMLGCIVWVNHLNHLNSSVWWIVIYVVVMHDMVLFMMHNMMTTEIRRVIYNYNWSTDCTTTMEAATATAPANQY